VKAGPGDNGGIMCLDGPTFVATEGWDWIPGVRDRNTGIWQDVTLTATGAVDIGDAHVVTVLSLPDTRRADVNLTIPLRNESGATISGTLKASFEGVSLAKSVSVPPGGSVVTLGPSEFPQLTVSRPRLWWPTGYGTPELYHLKISFSDPQGESDNKAVRFGFAKSRMGFRFWITLVLCAGWSFRLRRQRVKQSSMAVMKASCSPPRAGWLLCTPARKSRPPFTPG
jgi:hypothetical protein